MPANPSSPSLSRRAFLRRLLPSANPQDRTVPAAPDLVTFDTPILTPNDRFYRPLCLSGTPPLAVAARDGWTLHVGGLVDRPLALDYAAIRARSASGGARTLLSMGNPPGGEYIGTAVWRGCSLRDLLREAGIAPEAGWVRFDGSDGYSTAVPLAHIMQHDALLAYEMNGALLPPAQGFPLRVLVPGFYDSKSPGWLTRITLLDQPHTGYWERTPRNWSAEAVIKTRAQIMTPVDGEHLSAGEPVALQGVAFAGLRRITAVAVSINRAAWMPVTLRPADGPHAWTQWYTLWTPPRAGAYRVAVRASDDSGFSQTRRAGATSDAFPDGTDAIHEVVYDVE